MCNQNLYTRFANGWNRRNTYPQNSQRLSRQRGRAKQTDSELDAEPIDNDEKSHLLRHHLMNKELTQTTEQAQEPEVVDLPWEEWPKKKNLYIQTKT